MDISKLLYLKHSRPKEKSDKFIQFEMRIILKYLSYEFSDRNEDMDVAFKNDIFSHHNAFCVNKLTLRDIFSRHHAVILVETDQESHHVGNPERKHIVYILVV